MSCDLAKWSHPRNESTANEQTVGIKMDFASWPDRPFKIGALTLDPQNPRVPDAGTPMSVRDTIAALVEFEDLYELAKKIARSGGLYPHESLIGVEEDGKKIIVEGNRRLAALMLLDNPDLAPDGQVKKFKSLGELIDAKAIEKARVVMAPSREAAAPLILARHSGDAVRRWQRGQHAKYIRSLLSPGHSIKDLAERIGESEADIAKSLRLDTMYHLAQTMPLDPATHAVVANPHEFNLSTLERLIDSPPTLAALGFSFTKDGGIAGSIEEAEFKKGFTRIIKDIVKGPEQGGIDTRSLNKRQDIDKYLQSLGTDKPDRKRKGAFTSESLLSGGQPPPASSIKTGKKTGGPVVPKDSKYLPPADFRLRTTTPRIKDVFKEFRYLKVVEQVNTCGVMLRVFFEMLVTDYLDKSGKMQTLNTELVKARKINNPNTHHPSMTQMMKFIMSDQAIVLPPQVRKTINRMIDNPASFLSFEQVNAFVHNIYDGPNEKDLRKLWHALEPLMKHIMI
jgi:hypothetical protein